MKVRFTNQKDTKQQLNGIKESFAILPNEVKIFDSSEFYDHEIERARQFLKVEFVPEIEILPTANVEKPKIKKLDKEV